MTDSWEIELDPNVADGQTLLFHYPVASDRTEYVQSFVRLEWGSRSDSWPTDEAIIRPYVAEAMPSLFSEAECRVVALDVKRTFWEKATILHEEAHRPLEQAIPSRYSRHYYDLAIMAESAIRDSALQIPELLKRVVEHKQLFFSRSWSSFSTAVPGTFRLIPPQERLRALEDDYRKMRIMIFEEPPTFQTIIKSLQRLEALINNWKITVNG